MRKDLALVPHMKPPHVFYAIRQSTTNGQAARLLDEMKRLVEKRHQDTHQVEQQPDDFVLFCLRRREALIDQMKAQTKLTKKKRGGGKKKRRMKHSTLNDID